MVWNYILAIHAACTFFMTGLVGAIQVLHYPVLGEAADIRATCSRHVQRAGPLIAPVMTAEMLTGLLLLASPLRGGLLTASLLLLGVIWFSTFFIQVPIHRHLMTGQGNPHQLVNRLVSTNWLRTGTWVARSLIVGALLLQALGSTPGN